MRTKRVMLEFLCSLALIAALIAVETLSVAAQQSSGAGQGTGQNQGTQSGSGQRAGVIGQSGVSTAPPQQGQTTSQGQTNQSSTIPATGNSTGVSGQSGTAAGQGGTIGGVPSQRAVPTASITGGAQSLPGAVTNVSGVTNLNLEQAIQFAVQNNLATLLAKERQREARGFERESRAGLLPNIAGTAYQASVTQNLAALGFQRGIFPGITTTFIGPFNNFDARAARANYFQLERDQKLSSGARRRARC